MTTKETAGSLHLAGSTQRRSWRHPVAIRFARSLTQLSGRQALASRLSLTQHTYEMLKSALLDGALAAGVLDIQSLADGLKVSATPVREALARLAVERLVTFVPQRGYSWTPPSAPDLDGLYALNHMLVRFALSGVRFRSSGVDQDAGRFAPLQGEAEGASCARLTSALIADIASAQDNADLLGDLMQSNDRLYLPRRMEPLVLPGALQDVLSLVALWREGDIERLGGAFERYYQDRRSHVDELARCLCAPPPPSRFLGRRDRRQNS